MFYGNKRLIYVVAAPAITIALLALNWLLGRNEYVPSFEGDGVLDGSQETSTSEPTIVKLAAIVETRPLENLVPVLLHFSSVLGPEWPIHIFTSEEVKRDNLTESLPFKRGVDAGRFVVRTLPEGTLLNNHASVSRFLTSPWLWLATAPADRVLIFQADSILCSNSPQSIDDFLEYDFMGAPIDSDRGLGLGWNGGLSIRNREMCLNIVTSRSWEEERHGDHSQGNVDYEDQWFAKAMRELPTKSDGKPGANLPTKEIAMKFAVETIWYDKPLGFHQASVWQAGKLEEIYQWCPEYKMSTSETFTDHSTDP